MFRKNIFWIFFCISVLMFGMTDNVKAVEHQGKSMEAEGFSKSSSLFDSNRTTYTKCKEEGSITLSNDAGIHSIYIEFDRLPNKWEMTNPDTGVSVTCGTNTFLHEFVDMKKVFNSIPTKLVLKFPADTTIADVYMFSNEEIPEWVQIWEPPCEEADLLLMSTHSDDEQLFFAGLLPYYAGEKGLKVQVAYMIQHFEVNGSQNHKRPHEQLDGLWTVGVRNYPVISEFPDLYAESKDRDVAYKQAEKLFKAVGITYDDFVAYATECLRRFKPLVVVSHDLNGEYGHGSHIFCASALTDAITYAADASKYTDSAIKYGTWNVEKLYLHLYEKNKIQMNYDIPLENFGGKTAFEVSKEGFDCHKSQHYTWFNRWLNGTADNPIKKASEITTYSPCQFGLYYTSVGNDVVGGDFLENVKTYEDRYLEKLKEEEAKRQEEERLEKERLEKERLEQERLEQERLEQEKTLQKKENAKKIALAIVCVIVVLIGGYVLVRRKNK